MRSWKSPVGQGRILSTRADLSGPGGKAVVAVGDPSVMDFVVLSPRQLRLIGHRLGSTDLSITTNDGQIFSFEVHVIADLSILEMRLKSLFPDASLTLSQASGNIVVSGQARSPGQVAHIIQIVTTHVTALTTPIPASSGGPSSFQNPANPNPGDQSRQARCAPSPMGIASPELNPATTTRNMIFGTPRIVNLIRIPTSQQVLLKVRIAELNRTSLRQIGANFLGVDPRNGAIVGTQIGVPATAVGQVGNSVTTPTSIGRQLYGGAETGSATATTLFGIFQDNHFEFMLSACPERIGEDPRRAQPCRAERPASELSGWRRVSGADSASQRQWRRANHYGHFQAVWGAAQFSADDHR